MRKKWQNISKLNLKLHICTLNNRWKEEKQKHRSAVCGADSK